MDRLSAQLGAFITVTDEAARLQAKQAEEAVTAAVRQGDPAGGDLPPLHGVPTAIKDLSLSVDAGEVCLLVGPSGSGKTTAMRLINRMIPLSGGDILLGGRSVLEREPNELRREIGYVIQQIGLFPHQTVAENIATVPKLLGWDKARTAARVKELLELIGLESDIGSRYPAQLSGGQRQRVGVARALAADPPLMVMPSIVASPPSISKIRSEWAGLSTTTGPVESPSIVRCLALTI